MMTVAEKLRVMDENKRINRERIEAWKAEGKMHVSPTEASKMLGCQPYSLNVSAQMGRFPEGAYFFAGRNLRIMVDWLERVTMGGNAS